MSQGGYLAIAIVIVVALAAFVIISFVVLRRMPAPKGCENLKASHEKCSGCGESGCPVYAKFHQEEEEE